MNRWPIPGIPLRRTAYAQRTVHAQRTVRSQRTCYRSQNSLVGTGPVPA